MKKYFIILAMVSSPAFSDDLSSKLDDLNVPDDKVTDLLSEENLISVTGRYSSLDFRHEFSIKGANNFTSDSHLETRQLSGTYRFHLNSRWSVGASYHEYENKLSSAGERLFFEKAVLPDSDFAIKAADAFIGLHTVYGKLRLTSTQVVYFDHYINIGYGHVDLASGEQQMYTADTGFVFWVGKHGSFRLGVKNEFYRQQKLRESKNAHNAMGYLEVGVLL